MEQSDRNERGDERRRTDSNTVPDSYLGGADAVEKTSYVGDASGADVGARAQNAPVTATVRSGGGGLGLVGWVVVLLAVFVLAAFAAGLFR